ncbi:MAG: sugar ABC transporter permease [Tissierellaceae bacterium]|nr:sugar ABC transporter permease [Tissierellaceae bacterium]
MEDKVLEKGHVKEIIKSPYLLLVPALLFYLIFWFVPVATSLYESFTTISGKVGLNNFILVLQDSLFLDAFVNTLIFALLSLLLQFALALGIAVLVNQNFKGSKLFLFVILIPMALPPSAIGILWNTGLVESGWINSFLATSGIQNVLEALGILKGPTLWKAVSGLEAVMTLIIIDTWTVMPSVMIIILAGLQNFNEEYKEAAQIFGATKWQAFRDVVIPIIKPSIVTALLLRLISGLQVWLIGVMLFGFNNVPFLVERIVYYTDKVRTATNSYKMANAYSIFTLGHVFTVAFLFLRVTKDKKEGAK